MNKSVKNYHGHINSSLDENVIYVRYFDENSSLQKFIIVIQFIIVIKFHLSGVNLSLWKFSSVMKIFIWIKIDYCDENTI